MAVAVPFTTAGEMQDEVGQDAILAWSDHDNVGQRKDSVVNQVIDRATQEILRAAGQRYSASGLSTDVEMRAWATTLACYYLSKKRGMQPPDSLAEEVEWIRDGLARLADGRDQLSGVSLKADLRPSVTNRTVDRRYSYRTVRKRPDSTGPHSVMREDRVNDAEEI